MITLQEIYKKYTGPHLGVGDKGSFHSYIDTYSIILDLYRDKKINFLEIGILEGHSIKMWKEYFTNANIYACDIIDKTHLNLSDNKTTILCGDATQDSLYQDLDIQFDIIIDDGSHLLTDQINSFSILRPRLSQHGIYIIEDIFYDHIEPIQQAFQNIFEVKDMRHEKQLADNILMIYYNK